jgi:DNA gyrase subunit A
MHTLYEGVYFNVVQCCSGKGYGVRAHKIPLCSRYARGTPIPQVIPLSIEDENVTSGVSISNVNKKTSLVMVTANGMIKKTHISYFYKLLFRPSSRGLKMIHLSGRDELRYLKTCTDDQEVVVASRYF